MVLSIRHFTSLFLTAALLAGTSALPAMRHAHLGGTHPHDHARPQARGQHEGHGHHHHGAGSHSHDHRPHDDSTLDETEASAVAVRHLHFSWFGIHFTLPQDSHNSQDDEPVDETIAFIRLNANEMTVSSQSSRLFEPFCVPHDVGSLTTYTASVKTAYAAARVPTHSLVCDAARGMRSGVLLI